MPPRTPATVSPSDAHTAPFRAFLGRLAPLTAEAWDGLLPALSLGRVKRRGHLVGPGDAAAEAAFVVEGLLESYVVDAQGAEAIKRFCPEGSLAAPYADLVLRRREASSFLRALEDTVVVRIDYACWLHLMDQHPCLQRVGRLIAEHEFIEREARELAFLLEDAQARLSDFEARYPTLRGRVPANRLAAYLGLNPVTLSRLRAARHARARTAARPGGDSDR